MRRRQILRKVAQEVEPESDGLETLNLKPNQTMTSLKKEKKKDCSSKCPDTCKIKHCKKKVNKDVNASTN